MKKVKKEGLCSDIEGKRDNSSRYITKKAVVQQKSVTCVHNGKLVSGYSVYRLYRF